MGIYSLFAIGIAVDSEMLDCRRIERAAVLADEAAERDVHDLRGRRLGDIGEVDFESLATSA